MTVGGIVLRLLKQGLSKLSSSTHCRVVIDPDQRKKELARDKPALKHRMPIGQDAMILDGSQAFAFG